MRTTLVALLAVLLFAGLAVGLGILWGQVSSLEGQAESGAGSGDQELEAELRRIATRLTEIEKQLEITRTHVSEGLELLDEQQNRLEETTQNRILRLRDSFKVQLGALRKELEARISPAAPADPADLKARLEEKGVTFEPEEGRVSVKGKVIQTKVLVEFVAVTDRGKTHESLFLLDCTPSALNAGLLGLGLRPGTPYEVKEEGEVPEDQRAGVETFEWEDPETEETKTLYYFPPRGDGVTVSVAWAGSDEEKIHRIEELILDSTTNAPLPPMSWVYLGSRFQYNPDTGEEVYVADYTGDIISIWHSYRGQTILDNPLVAGRDDEIYFANSRLLPAEGTPVTIIFEKAR